MSNKVLRVEELERYGKKLSDTPKGAFKGQNKLIIKSFTEKFGFFGIFSFIIKILVERRRILKDYNNEYKKIRQITPSGASEFVIMVSLFNVIAKLEGREKAYNFVQSIFHGIALNSMKSLYQLDDLEKCEGDIFDNYKKMNIAMFQASKNEFNIKKIEESENHLRIIIDKCLNVEAAKMLDCPEVAKLGCDHDLVAYPLIADRVNSVMIRPCTLAKGGNCCDFNFYRKGFEPEGEHINL